MLFLQTNTDKYENEKLFESDYDKISKYAKEKIDKMKYKKDKNLSLAAEMLFMQGLEKLGIEYSNVKIELGEFGKPYIKNIEDINCESMLVNFGKKIYYNKSHSGNCAICVFYSTNVGCDVQIIQDRNFDKILVSSFGENEAKIIKSLQDKKEKLDAFFKLWTIKESFVKCIGKGLTQSLKEPEIIDFLEKDKLEISYDTNLYQILIKDIGEKYKCAICIEKE